MDNDEQVRRAKRERAMEEFLASREVQAASQQQTFHAQAPPGWYPDQQVPETERYWTGAVWSDVTRPRVRPKPDPTYAWLLTVVPLLPVAVALLAPSVYGAGDVVLIATIALSSVLAYADSRRLQAVGSGVNSGWALLVPVYLILRTRAVHSSPAIPVTWFGTFFLSIVALATFAAVYDYSGASVGTYIGQQLRQQPGGGGITVTCPDMVGLSGTTYVCTARDRRGQSAQVQVTLGGSSGYTWYLSGG